VSNLYTERLIQRTQAAFGADFWGFWMLGGMSGGGMGFIFAPERRREGQERLQEIMLTAKRELETALPFAMDPVVYDFAINEKRLRRLPALRRGRAASGRLLPAVPFRAVCGRRRAISRRANAPTCSNSPRPRAASRSLPPCCPRCWTACCRRPPQRRTPAASTRCSTKMASTASSMNRFAPTCAPGGSVWR